MLRAIGVLPPPWVNDPTALSESLKKYRLQVNLSQTKLVAKLGVTVSAVGRWERGQATPSRESWPGAMSTAG